MATAGETSGSANRVKRSPPGSSDGSAKKSSRESNTESSTPATQSSIPKRRSSGRRDADPKRMGAQQLAAEASRQLLEMTGKDPEGISGLRRSDDDGWLVEVEVLELRRIPSTTDVLATYEVEVDSRGELLEYRRVRRYVRGVPGEGGR